jgi:hypothetical protein
MLLPLVFFQCRTKKETTYKNFIYHEKYLLKANPAKQTSNVLYLLDGKKISSDTMRKISTDSISSIHVIKDVKKIKKYTPKKYDGIILIRLKKK